MTTQREPHRDRPNPAKSAHRPPPASEARTPHLAYGQWRVAPPARMAQALSMGVTVAEVPLLREPKEEDGGSLNHAG